MRIARNAFHAVLLLVSAEIAYAADNPYREEGWAKFADGRRWGWASAIDIDRRGNIWVFERCGANSCAGSKVAPLVQLTPLGKVLKTFGAGMFAFPHGLYVDRAGAIWVTDAEAKDGKGNVVVKFNPAGKGLLTLGKAGAAG